MTCRDCGQLEPHQCPAALPPNPYVCPECGQDLEPAARMFGHPQALAHVMLHAAQAPQGQRDLYRRWGDRLSIVIDREKR